MIVTGPSFINDTFESNTAVVGHTMSLLLFNTNNPIGKTLTVQNERFVVVGVLREVEESINFNNVDCLELSIQSPSIQIHFYILSALSSTLWHSLFLNAKIIILVYVSIVNIWVLKTKKFQTWNYLVERNTNSFFSISLYAT